MAKDSEEAQTIIIDTNVLFSSLVKAEGYTQAVLAILLPQKQIAVKVLASIKYELLAHDFKRGALWKLRILLGDADATSPRLPGQRLRGAHAHTGSARRDADMGTRMERTQGFR